MWIYISTPAYAFTGTFTFMVMDTNYEANYVVTPFSCHFLHLGTKYSQHPAPKSIQFLFFSSCVKLVNLRFLFNDAVSIGTVQAQR
jgi:hypothetical protein